MSMTDKELLEMYPHGMALWEKIADKSPTILIAFSRGKDSLAMAIELKKSKLFKEMVFFYKYRIPEISFVQEGIRYYENFFQTKIHQLPHPALYRMLNEYVFQAPENCDFIYRAQIPNFSHEFLTEEFKKDMKLSPETFSATGVRAQDSLNRRMAVFKYSPINNTNHNFMPIWNYSKKDCFKIISESGCKLPVDYELFGRSFDGINYQFLKPLKEKYPEDYQKILDLFPLADLELKRIEFYKKHKAESR